MYEEIGVSVKESNSYIIYRNSLIGFILNAIVSIWVSCFVFYFKDATTEEIKQKIKEKQILREFKKEEKKKKELEKLENKIKELKEERQSSFFYGKK